MDIYHRGTTTIPTELTAIIRPGDNNSSIQEGDYVKHRNNYRLPATHRLNVGVNFSKKTRHGMRIWNVSIYNVYNAMNPTLVYRTYKRLNILKANKHKATAYRSSGNSLCCPVFLHSVIHINSKYL